MGPGNLFRTMTISIRHKSARAAMDERGTEVMPARISAGGMPPTSRIIDKLGVTGIKLVWAPLSPRLHFRISKYRIGRYSVPPRLAANAGPR